METKVLGSNKIYTHHWQKGDLLVLNNPSLAHLAGPGSQGSLEATGLRLMHRSTVPGLAPPSKKTNLEYVCHEHKPFEEGYCLFSLKVILKIYSLCLKNNIMHKPFKIQIKFNVSYLCRDLYSTHATENLKRLKNNEKDVKMFMIRRISLLYQMKLGTRFNTKLLHKKFGKK